MNTLTDFASSRRGKWITLAAWLVFGGLIISLSPTLTDITTNDTLQFLPQDAESTRAAELARQRYATDATPAIIVFNNPDGLTDANLAAAEEASSAFSAMAEEAGSDVASVVSIFTVPQARAELVSPDETTMTMIVNITGSPAEAAYADRIEALRDVTDPLNSEQLAVKVSGPGGLVADLVSVFSNINTFLLFVTIGLVLVLLVLIYRSPVVALVPILLVGLVFQLSSGVGALILDAVDFAVSGQTTGIMTVILFGAGTDYFLFISSRYREELSAHEDKHEAMREAMRGVSGAISSAAGTLILASSILLLANLGSYQSLGPVIAIAIALMLLAALTLVPAVLAILGRVAFWPFRPTYDPASEGDSAEETGSAIWERIADFVLGRSGRMLTATSLVLVLLAAGTLLLEPSYDSLESLPSDVDSVEGFQLLREGFPPGQLAPTDVYVELPDGTDALSGEGLETVAAISETIAGVDGVEQVTSPAYPRGVAAETGPEQVAAAIEAIPPELREQIESGEGGPPDDIDPGSETAQAVGIYASALNYLSTDGEVSRIEVTLDSNPYGNAAMDTIPEIRDAASDTAEELGLARSAVLAGGETAENYDTRVANNRDTVIVLPLILVAIMIVLGILLRSVIAALYIGATIILTYFATLGLAVLAFLYIFGHDSIGSSVPFFLFVFLNALGVDYSIYLMSRVREEAEERDLTSATRVALSNTGGVITSAGLILAGTFGALMTLPLQDLFQLGFAVSVGVLMDTFITRSLLVPSLVELLGRWNWWPSSLPGAQAAAGDDVR